MVIWLSQSTDEKGEVPEHLVISFNFECCKIKDFPKTCCRKTFDAEGGDREHYGKLRELHPSSPVSRLSYFKLGFFFSLYVISDMKKKIIEITLFTKKNGDWFYLITY